MITYKSCSEVTMNQVFDAFALGFSDYIIPMNMSQALFESRFFGPEGNSLEHSFIALDQESPIGLILGGIRMFDGLMTMRCGTLCVAPNYRGKGVSQRLLALHRETAIKEGCKQLFLEVIKGNDRAIQFYEKNQYSKTYHLKYYAKMAEDLPSTREIAGIDITQINFSDLKAVRDNLKDCHINWQSDMPYYEGSADWAYFSAVQQKQVMGAIAMSPQGKVCFLWVEPAFRNQGIATQLLQRAVQAQKVEKIMVCLPNNASLEGFFRKLGFQKEGLEQYEMNLPL